MLQGFGCSVVTRCGHRPWLGDTSLPNMQLQFGVAGGDGGAGPRVMLLSEAELQHFTRLNPVCAEALFNDYN